MKAIVLVALLGATAAAEPNKLGFGIHFGRLTAFDARQTTASLALGIEHPLGAGARVFGEYEWMWFGLKDPMLPGDKGMPGEGHRGTLGLRGELLGTTIQRELHLYVDGEVGASFAVLADDHDQVALQPAAFVGARIGYDFLWGHRTNGSRTFEAELVARYSRMTDGTHGVLFGIGMLWGD